MASGKQWFSRAVCNPVTGLDLREGESSAIPHATMRPHPILPETSGTDGIEFSYCERVRGIW
jgi:hypothetical protein